MPPIHNLVAPGAPISSTASIVYTQGVAGCLLLKYLAPRDRGTWGCREVAGVVIGRPFDARYEVVGKIGSGHMAEVYLDLSTAISPPRP